MKRPFMYIGGIATLLLAGASSTASAAGPDLASKAGFFAAPKQAAAKPAADGKDAKEKEAKPAAPGEITKPIALSPKGFKFGLNNEQIAKLYDKVFEQEFVPLYRRVQPGPRMEALDAELAAKKGLIRRSVVKFGNSATGVDETPLRGEYTYRNDESMSRINLRNGTVRHFFFFGNRSWKIYDERPLRKGSMLGTSFETATAAIAKAMGAPPILLAADPEQGRSFDEAIWMNDDLLVRLVNREYQGKVGLVYVSKAVQQNITSYRKNKEEDPGKLSKDIERITSKEPAQPPAAEKPKK